MSRVSRAAVFAVCLAGILLAGASHGQPSATGGPAPASLTVEAVWARVAPGTARSGAVYFRIVNRGRADDRLVGASSPVAARVELHTHRMQGGVMRMRRVEAVPVPGGGAAELAPGGNHVMLIGLRGPLEEGETFPLTLAFEKAGAIGLQVPVRPLTARGPGAHHRGHR